MKEIFLPFCLCVAFKTFSQQNESIRADMAGKAGGKAIIKVTNKLSCSNPVESEGRIKILPAVSADTFQVNITATKSHTTFFSRRGCFADGRIGLEVSVKVLAATITNARFKLEKY